MIRRKAPEHANHERWLVSYADFITLLFAFFVVMFASTQADKSKAKDGLRVGAAGAGTRPVQRAISTVLGRGKHEAKKAPLNTATRDGAGEPDAPPTGAAWRRPADLVEIARTLQKGLDAELKNGQSAGQAGARAVW